MTEYGILTDIDMGRCPSCKETMMLPALIDLDKMITCPKCKAFSYGYKWLSDRGKAARNKMNILKEKMNDIK